MNGYLFPEYDMPIKVGKRVALIGRAIYAVVSGSGGCTVRHGLINRERRGARASIST